jgi:hypothetical protein
MSKSYYADFNSDAWKALSHNIDEQGSHRCRNCSSSEHLVHHHFFPEGDKQIWGDKVGEGAICFDAGMLITLCSQCFKQLPKNQIERLSASSGYCRVSRERPWLYLLPKDIIWWWIYFGMTTPFNIRNINWRSQLKIEEGSHYLVEEIIIKVWPTTWEVRGRYGWKGKYYELEEIKKAQINEWVPIIDGYDEEEGIWYSGGRFVAKQEGNLAKDPHTVIDNEATEDPISEEDYYEAEEDDYEDTEDWRNELLRELDVDADGYARSEEEGWFYKEPE